MKYLLPAGVKGRGIIAFSWQATALFAITAILAAITPSALRVPALTVALVLFAIGMIIFLVAYIVAIGRSRYAVISVVGVAMYAIPDSIGKFVNLIRGTS